jgi:hypothetical protein
VLLAQILIDLTTCLVVADLGSPRDFRTGGENRVFLLAALCPFLANYAAAELTETLEIFFTALALDGAAGRTASDEQRWAARTGSGPRLELAIAPAFCCVPMAASCWRRSCCIWRGNP